MVDFLLNSGCDINYQNDYGKSALHLVAQLRSSDANPEDMNELMALLLSNGADADIRDNEGNKPLHNAVKGWNSRLAST